MKKTGKEKHKADIKVLQVKQRAFQVTAMTIKPACSFWQHGDIFIGMMFFQIKENGEHIKYPDKKSNGEPTRKLMAQLGLTVRNGVVEDSWIQMPHHDVGHDPKLYDRIIDAVNKMEDVEQRIQMFMRQNHLKQA
ncbi:hypothetical protein LCGC14_2071500 [marine sediment metagenome]|uniref:Uncharacterized protein n=1 Tax=marine sediment metagenome TaxID=412755 RepID=A0A0F9HFB5_9ZZZZ